MARTLLSMLGGCLALLLAGGGILFLGWLLYWLWSRQQKEEPETKTEIELDATAPDTGLGAVPGMEEKELPPPEEEELLPAPAEDELLPEPEEEELLPEPEEAEPGADRVPVVVEVESPQAIPVADVEGPGAPDDLRVIEGIGPRIAGVLRAGGIRTFQDLAAADVAQIEAILTAEDARLARLATPDTWPEQAAFAAAGDWEGLAVFTETLKRGRRV